jgi:hypothetical protein
MSSFAPGFRFLEWRRNVVTPRLARRSPWIWAGFCLVLVTGVTVTAAGAGRKAPHRPAASVQAPAAAPAAADGRADSANPDRDVCEQQLD